MTGKVRLAMIGCGDISQQYLKAAAAMECAEIVVVMDAVQAHAEKLGREYDKEYTTDYEGILSRKDVDAVIVSVPHYLHKDLVLQAAKAKKHVLCDKPISTNVADGRKMIAACKKAGVQLAINFPKRYASKTQKAKELIEAGVIGEVIYIMSDERGYKPESYWSQGWSGRVKTDWRGSKEKAGGGVLIMNMIHTVDAIRYTTGLEPVWVSGLVNTFVSSVEVEDTAAAVMKMSNGAMYNIASASSLAGSKPNWTTIHGKLGQIVPENPVRVYTTRTDTQFKAGEWTEIPVAEDKLQYVPYLTATCKALLEGREVPITGTEGLKSLAAILAIYESSKSGKPVVPKA